MNENNFNKTYNDSTTSSTTNINYNNNYCCYRLPCGYCRILEKACPMCCSNTFGAIKDSDIKY